MTWIDEGSGLGFLAAWSIRWAILVAPVAAWLALWPPRRAATRQAACSAAVVAGLLLRWMPRRDVRWVVPPEAGAIRVVAAPSTRPIEPDAAALHVEPDRPRSTDRAASPATPRQAPDRRRFDLGRAASRAATLAWLAGASITAARLAVGRRSLGRLRSEARPAAGPWRRELARSRRELGLRRRVGLATHPAVRSPVVVGSRRPSVLVPPDWGRLPAATRRACLLHELAHLRRRDDLWKPLRELVRVPFFFHPAVCWLLSRLDREGELLCDEAAVRLGVPPRDLAKALVEFARRPGRLGDGGWIARPAALAFFGRGTVRIRVLRLMEDDMMKTASTPSLRRSGLAAVASLGVAVLVGGARVRAVEPARPAPVEQAQGEAHAASRIVAGFVRDSEKRPIADVVVLVGIEAEGYRREILKTSADGQFRLSIPDGFVGLEYVLYQDGFSAETTRQRVEPGAAPDSPMVTLFPAKPFVAILVDRQGKPVSGAAARVERTSTRKSARAADGRLVSATVGSSGTYPERLIAGSPLEAVFTATSDAAGLIRLPAAVPDHSAEGFESYVKLAVTSGEAGLRVALQPPGPDQTFESGAGFVAGSPEAPPRVTLVPEARIVGRVASSVPWLPAAGRRIGVSGGRLRGANSRRVTTTDDAGRFTVPALDEGAVVVGLAEPEGNLWSRRPVNVPLQSGKTTEVTIELIEGVDVGGRVLAPDGRPGGIGIEIGARSPSDFGPGMRSTTRTDGDGRYRLCVLPGEQLFYVSIRDPEDLMKMPEVGRPLSVLIREGITRFDTLALLMLPMNGPREPLDIRPMLSLTAGPRPSK